MEFDTFSIYGGLIALLGWLIPIALIVWLVRVFSHRHESAESTSGKSVRRSLQSKDVVLLSLIVPAGVAGSAGLYLLPQDVFGYSSDDAASFAIRVVCGVILLVGGLYLKRITGIFIMCIGAISILLASPYVFNNLGSAGALLVVFLAFIGLIGAALWLNKKDAGKAVSHE